ncbi:MAG TPA: hypothetical protein VN696_03715 [Pyrinomonadaceae bacterium]|nr:hypothetical protein [Pyrinomonadaceae bacterium]
MGKEERDEMRERRNTNRTRVRNGLKENGNPKPMDFFSQGSYAMRTMVQHKKKDYDIDDGIYFDEGILTNSNGTQMSASQSKHMIRDAVDDGSFTKKPDVRSNCVRVYYQTGYHVDLPVYQRVSSSNGTDTEYYELASDEWKRSDARDVTAWFEGECSRLSVDKEDGGQLRRVCRLIKKFARSREGWRDQIASGFMITKLLTECYVPAASRDDVSLVDSIRSIHDRLTSNLIVEHPVTPDETITNGDADICADFLRSKLSDALGWLDCISRVDCTQEEALKAWDKVFNTDYFIARLPDDQKKRVEAPTILKSGLVRDWAEQSPARVEKRGGHGYA